MNIFKNSPFSFPNLLSRSYRGGLRGENRIRSWTGVLRLGLPLLALSASAVPYTATWNSGFANSGVVPDGNVAGWSDTRTLSGISGNSILDVDVTLHLTGGWNGDLYVYLQHSSGFSVLLNRTGRTAADPFGYADAGMNVTFHDAAANGDIHRYQTMGGFGTSLTDGSLWSPDGRHVNPLNALDTDARTAMLNSFNGLDPNGSWTLFVADLSGGAVSTVSDWGLSIETEQQVASVTDNGATFTLLSAAIASLTVFRKRSCVL